MKKFILAALASAMLLPTPAFATEMEEVNVYEEMTDEEAISIESSATSLKSTSIVFKLENGSTQSTKTLSLSQNEDTSKAPTENLVRLYALLPDGYHFKKAPTTVNTTVASQEFIIVSDAGYTMPSQPSSAQKVYLQYKVSDSDNNPFVVTLNNVSIPTSDSTPLITVKDINTKIADEVSKLYKTSSNVYFSELKAIYEEDNSSSKTLKPIAYILAKPRTLNKEVIEDLGDKTIDVSFGKNSQVFKLRIGNFNPDANGNFTINTTNLKAALVELTKDEDGKVLGNSTFDVSQVAEKNSNNGTVKVNAYTHNGTLNLPNAKITVGYTSSTPIYLKMKTNAGGILVDSAMATYGDLVATSGTNKGSITADKVNSFVKNNYGRLTFISADFTSIPVNYNLEDSNLSEEDLKKTLPPNAKTNPYSITVSADGANYDTLLNTPYKITFKDSTTDAVIETENRVWSNYFKNQATATLTRGQVTSDFLPSPSQYRVADSQTPKSTADTKKKPADGNDFSLSIYQTNAVIYFTAMKNTTSSGGGSAVDKDDSDTPTTPTTPDTPVTPEEPMAPSIPSKGRSVMYRVYNPETHEHLYTQDAAERDNLLASGWNDEGHGWTAPAISSYKVYRVFNPNSGEHHYTMDQNEYDTLISYGWTGEGTAFFSANDVDDKVTLYRLYHPNAPESAKHHYTMDENERNQMIADGWIPEGTAWYGLPN